MKWLAVPFIGIAFVALGILAVIGSLVCVIIWGAMVAPNEAFLRWHDRWLETFPRQLKHGAIDAGN